MLSNWIYTVPKALALPWRKLNSVISEMRNLGWFLSGDVLGCAIQGSAPRRVMEGEARAP